MQTRTGAAFVGRARDLDDLGRALGDVCQIAREHANVLA
jgi:hypothetical protein